LEAGKTQSPFVRYGKYATNLRLIYNKSKRLRPQQIYNFSIDPTNLDMSRLVVDYNQSINQSINHIYAHSINSNISNGKNSTTGQ